MNREEIDNGRQKISSKSGGVHESLASDAAAAVIGKHMDERAALVESALKKRTNAEAHHHIARGAEQEYLEAVRGSVCFCRRLPKRSFRKSRRKRAALTAALISAYGTGLVEIHLKLGRPAGMIEDARTHLESLPEFAKHAL